MTDLKADLERCLIEAEEIGSGRRGCYCFLELKSTYCSGLVQNSSPLPVDLGPIQYHPGSLLSGHFHQRNYGSSQEIRNRYRNPCSWRHSQLTSFHTLNPGTLQATNPRIQSGLHESIGVGYKLRSMLHIFVSKVMVPWNCSQGH